MVDQRIPLYTGQGSGYDVAGPEDDTVSWGDYADTLLAGGANVGAGIAGLADYATDGAIGGGTRDALSSYASKTIQGMSPRASAALGADILPSGDRPSVWDEGVGRSLAFKVTAATPSLVAALIPGGVVGASLRTAGAGIGASAAGGAIAARGTGAALAAGDVVNDIYERVGNMTDDELAAQSDVFAGYRDLMGAEAARRRYFNDLVGYRPVVMGAVSYALGGVEGQLGARLGGAAAGGVLQGARKGLATEGLQEAAEEGGGAFLTQDALRTAGLDDMQWRDILSRSLEGGVVGGALGGVAGGVGGIGGRRDSAAIAEPALDEPLTPFDEPAPAEDTALEEPEAAPAAPPVAPVAAPRADLEAAAAAIPQKRPRRRKGVEMVPESGVTEELAVALATANPQPVEGGEPSAPVADAPAGLVPARPDSPGPDVTAPPDAGPTPAPVALAPEFPVEPVTPEVTPAARGFQTEKGSTYVVHEDGTTTRDKAARTTPGHEGDAGPKARTTKTVYVDGSAAALSAAGMTLARPDKGARVVFNNGAAALLLWNEEAGDWGRSSEWVPVHTEPAPGRYPLELWSPADDVRGLEAYGRMHAGSKITSLSEPVPVAVAPSAPPEPVVGAAPAPAVATSMTTVPPTEPVAAPAPVPEPRAPRVLEEVDPATGKPVDRVWVNENPVEAPREVADKPRRTSKREVAAVAAGEADITKLPTTEQFGTPDGRRRYARNMQAIVGAAVEAGREPPARAKAAVDALGKLGPTKGNLAFLKAFKDHRAEVDEASKLKSTAPKEFDRAAADREAAEKALREKAQLADDLVFGAPLPAAVLKQAQRGQGGLASARPMLIPHLDKLIKQARSRGLSVNERINDGATAGQVYLAQASKLLASLRGGRGSDEQVRDFLTEDFILRGTPPEERQAAIDEMVRRRREAGDAAKAAHYDENAAVGGADASVDPEVAGRETQTKRDDVLVDPDVEHDEPADSLDEPEVVARERPKPVLAEGEGYTVAQAKAPPTVEVKKKRVINKPGVGAKGAAVLAKAAGPIKTAAARVDTAPSDAQKEAGNYQKGHVRIAGMDITIETPEGATRSGIAPDGTKWLTVMPAHYGYVKRTKGADGDQVDVYLTDAGDTGKVYVFDQYDPKTGKFDEHKAVIGARHAPSARLIYDAGFSDGSGPDRAGPPTEMATAEFEAWAETGDTSKPLGKVSPTSVLTKAAEPAPTSGVTTDRTVVLDWNDGPNGEMETGRPLVADVVHGTTAVFDKFSKAFRGTNFLSDFGAIWFTDNTDAANSYARQKQSANDRAAGKEPEGAPNVHLARIKMDNPLVVPNAGRYDPVVWNRRLKQAAEGGHDGVVMLDAIDGGGAPANVFAVFDDTQIKPRFEDRSDGRLFRLEKDVADEDALFARAARWLLGRQKPIDGPLNPDTGKRVRALENGTVKDFLARADFKSVGPLASTMGPFMRSRLNQLVGSTKVYVVDGEAMAQFYDDPEYGARVLGFYDRRTGEIVLHERQASGTGFAVTLLHEAVHAAFEQQMRPGSQVRAHVEAIMDAADWAARDAGGAWHYGLANADEFVAEAFSNQVFQRFLASVPASGGLIERLKLDRPKASLWQTLVSLVRKTLGLPPGALTLLDAAMDIGRKLDGLASHKQQGDRLRAEGLLPSRMPQLLPPGVTERLGDMAPGRQLKTRKLALALSTLDQIRQRYRGLFQDATGDALEELVEKVQRVQPFVNRKREASDALAQRFLDYARKNATEARGFAMLALDATGANVNLIDGATKRDAADAVALLSGKEVPGASELAKDLAAANAHLGKDAFVGVQSKAHLGQMQEDFGKLSPAGRELWADMAAYYRDTQNEITRGVIHNVLREHDDTLSDADRSSIVAKTMAGTLDDEARKLLNNEVTFNALNNTRQLRVIKGVYFPMMRHGQFVVQTRERFTPPAGAVLHPDGKLEFRHKTKVGARRAAQDFLRSTSLPFLDHGTVPDTATDTDFGHWVRVQTEGLHFFDGADEAARFVREHGGDYAEVSGVQQREDDSFGSGGIQNSDLAAMMRSLEQRYPDDADKGKLKVLKATLRQVAVSTMTGNRVQHRSLPRRRVLGASTDFTRNVLQYGEASSSYLGKIRYMPEIRDAMSRMRKVVKGAPFAHERPERGQVLAEIERRVEKNVANVTESPAWVRDWMAISFIDKLASPAYSMVNAMQPTMVTLPVLAGRYGLTSAGNALQRAYRDIGGARAISAGIANTGRALKHFRDFAVVDATDVLGSVKAQLDKAPDGATLKPMLDELVERGALDPGAGFELAQSFAEGRGYLGSAIARVDRAARQLPAAVEQVNRAVAAIAAYRLARASGKADADARSAALDVVMNTQGDYSPQNAPPIFNHPVFKISLQFKKYGQMMYALLGDLIHKSLKDASAAERKVARRQLASLVAVHVLAAGAAGIPGLEVVKLAAMAFAALGVGGGAEDLEDKVRQALVGLVGVQAAELAMKGVVSRALNLDLSDRLGADQFLTFGEPRGYKEADAKAWLMDFVGGAPLGLVSDSWKAAAKFSEGDALGGAQLVPMPKVIADVIKAANQATSPRTSDRTGKVTQEPIGLGTAVVNAIGLRTGTQAEQSAKRAAEFRERGKVAAGTTDATKLKNQFAQAKTEGDRVKVLARLKDHNAGRPAEEQVTPAQLRSFAKRYAADEAKGKVVGGYRLRNEAERRRVEQAGSYYNAR